MVSKREEYVRSIRQRDIILFGAGDYAVRFYQRFKDILSVIGCVSNNKRERVFCVEGEEICPILRVEEIECDGGKFIIVCAKDYLPMEEQLKAMGMHYGRDFIDSETFGALCSEKKIALFYGVCYTRAVCKCLQNSKEFTMRYHAYYWMEYLKMDAIQEEVFSYMMEFCDLYIYNSFLSSEKRKANEAYISRLDKQCVRIGIPVLIFNGYYPCEAGKIGRDNKYNVISNQTPYATFLTPDHNVNRMMEEGIGFREILKRVSDRDFYKKQFVVKNYEKEMKKLELAEKIADIKICDFLYGYHQKKRLFLNEKHISNVVIMELAGRILDRLGMARDIRDNVVGERLLYTSEVPVYPSVIEHLSLEIYKGTYTLFTFRGDVKVTFEEYMERYYDYCMMMKQCFECGYFPFMPE